MAITKNDAQVVPYSRQNASSTEDTALYLANELRRIENTLRSLTQISNQVYTSEPKVKLNGMIVSAKAPWNPLGTGDGLAYWNGSAWTAMATGGGGGGTGLTHPQVMARVSLRF